ncbi:MAG: hypothetical protein IPL40_04975 [Proteobacteria bacterium]|nr:hypothetical protein [Pseudomonadota bacterium]
MGEALDEQAAGAGAEPRCVRRWRVGTQVVHLVATVALCLWVAASVVATHAGAYENKPAVSAPRISSRADNPEELIDCQRRLQGLLTELHQEAFALQARAVRFGFDPGGEWANWTEGWRWRWQLVAHRCRLEELANRGVSPAIDLLAEVHRALDELQLSYSDVVYRFIDRYLERLRHLNQQLTRARSLITAGRLVSPQLTRPSPQPAEPPRDPN